MRNQKLLTQIPGELEHAVKCRFNRNCTLDDIANTLQDVRKRTNIAKFTPYRSSSFKEKQPFKVEFKDKPKERVAEVAKNKNSKYYHMSFIKKFDMLQEDYTIREELINARLH
ncbi:hypothetical protein O181_021534 [Austropuccinia psidii MF-1]|uniref:Uncharacterized protein n=1 Tax=Austropuccinia psidii MF-1 TaxID=1389203 RepID=A0A9Q3CD84_9BASI|nr:hypothetical protein [Austropuccinia psidii MF-1]